MTIQSQIESKLQASLQPAFLAVENESHMHNVPPGSESHFRVVAVSQQFEGQRAVARHQAVYRALSDEMSGGVHALALHTYTPEEWERQQQQAPASPQCLGGSKAD
ncbi:transcriptional regulator BolA [Pseudomaricurvus sp. HS19]|uniref:transcriptional regulator BolA n=1 Tax=Pseudomaricurvus sp. HS19 TaxID=2692626 RepID=UPI00136CBB2D|nr:transcriptional regulator BolA [Pseudomaricurvus sp. HS19]MYM62774.1 transcriptional regulator BolA [Pseudomaricurvus sp. HS19]